MFPDPFSTLATNELSPNCLVTEMTYKNKNRPLTLNELIHVPEEVVIHGLGFSKEI